VGTPNNPLECRPLLTKRLGSVGGLLNIGGTTRGMKQPDTDRHHERHRNDHPKQQSGDIGRAKLSDTWHTPDYSHQLGSWTADSQTKPRMRRARLPADRN
jgi:hypothetical protein